MHPEHFVIALCKRSLVNSLYDTTLLRLLLARYCSACISSTERPHNRHLGLTGFGRNMYELERTMS